MSQVNLNRLWKDYLRRPASTLSVSEKQLGVMEYVPPASTSRNDPTSKKKDSPLALAVATAKLFQPGSQRTPEQQKGIEEIKKFWSTNDGTEIKKFWKLGDGTPMSKLSDAKITELIDNFSTVFFLNDLPSVHFEFNTFNIQDIKAGFAQHFCGGPTHVRVDPGDFFREKGELAVRHKAKLVGTIFHEIIHAYFMAFSCDKKDQVPNYGGKCEHRTVPFGGSGHNFAWVFLAAGIEIALKKLDVDVDLAVFRSMVREFGEEGDGRYRAVEWKLLFDWYGWEGVDQLVQKLDHNLFNELGTYLQKRGDVVGVFEKEHQKKNGTNQPAQAEPKRGGGVAIPHVESDDDDL